MAEKINLKELAAFAAQLKAGEAALQAELKKVEQEVAKAEQRKKALDKMPD